MTSTFEQFREIYKKSMAQIVFCMAKIVILPFLQTYIIQRSNQSNNKGLQYKKLQETISDFHYQIWRFDDSHQERVKEENVLITRHEKAENFKADSMPSSITR